MTSRRWQKLSAASIFCARLCRHTPPAFPAAWRYTEIIMARVELRRAENVAGDFFVDSTCIDCDLCRQIAPATFKAVGKQSAVHCHPRTPDDATAALKALITCPTASIGTTARHDTK